VVFIPLNLHYAKKSGRLSPVAAFVGEALGLKPIMTFIDGDTKVLTKARGDRNAIAAVVDFCVKQRKSGTPYLLIKGSNAELADKLLESSRQALQEEPALEFYIGGVVSINSGPELIGLVYRV
jgi:fatty acid-binding protein DegV